MSERPESAASAQPPSRTEALGLPLAIPFVEALGIRLVELGGGRAVATLTPEPTHVNSWAVAHGGVLMTMLDFGMAMAGRSAYEGDASDGRNLTVEMKTSFLRPGTGPLTARCQCIQAGRSLAFCEGEIVDAEGRTVARASGTFKFLRG